MRNSSLHLQQLLSLLVILYAATAVHAYTFAIKIEVIVVLLTSVLYRKKIARNLTPWLTALFILSIVIPFASWLYVTQFHTSWAEDYPKLDKLPKLFIFFFIALILSRSERLTFLFATTFISSLFLSPWISGYGSQELLDAFNGSRIDFGIKNAQHTAFLFGTAAILATSIAIYKFSSNKFYSLFYIALALTSLIAMQFSQSRGVTLAIICACLTLFVLQALYGKSHKKILLATASLSAISILLMQLPGFGNLSYRLVKELTHTSVGLDAGLEAIPYNSIGTRLHSWDAGLHFYQSSPVFGLGDQAQTLSIQRHPDIPESIKNEFRHLHSSHIELLVRYGLAGAVWYIAFMAYIASLTTGSKATKLLVPTFLTFWIVANFFESYVFYYTGKVAFTMILAIAFSYKIKPTTTPECCRSFS